MTNEQIRSRIEALIAEAGNTGRVNEEQAPSRANTSVANSLESIRSSLRDILTALSAGEDPPACPCCGNTATERARWACAQCGYNSLAAPAPQEDEQ